MGNNNETGRSPSIRNVITRVGLTGIACGGILGFKDGTDVVTKRETTCWQCPGGDNMTRMEEQNCAAYYGRKNKGSIAKGDQLKVEKKPGIFNEANYGGFTRVNAENVYSYSEYTGENSDLGPDICWVKTRDLKKVKK